MSSEAQQAMVRTVELIHGLAGEGREALLRWALWARGHELPVASHLEYQRAGWIELCVEAARVFGLLLLGGLGALMAWDLNDVFGAVVGVLVVAAVIHESFAKWRRHAEGRAISAYLRGRLDRAERILTRIGKRGNFEATKHPQVLPLLIAVAWRRGLGELALARAQRHVRTLQALVDAGATDYPTLRTRFAAQATLAWLQLDLGRTEAARASLLALPERTDPAVLDQLVENELWLRYSLQSTTTADLERTSALDALVTEIAGLPDELSPLSVSIGLLAVSYERLGESDKARHWVSQLETRGDPSLLPLQLPALLPELDRLRHRARRQPETSSALG